MPLAPLPMPAEAQARRCAVYTRKSSEEGLEQSFNSLDAQREACLAYVQSQRQEGWRALDTAYDDGGYSGGNMDRPALTRLLADMDARLVDVVVVYKVDRLTRSLADFAKIIERFDARGVSFVSVTQQFNTTSSMGKLTLNVLLSFAQFEREVTGERIRDKIAASKKKGMYMGGRRPIGYRVIDRKLVPDEAEAEEVRRIYRTYLKLGCVAKLKAELDRTGVCSAVRVSRRGKRSGGLPYSRGALYDLLQNRVYLGEIKHRHVAYPGVHEPIVPKALWDKTQARLKANRQATKEALRAKEPSLLLGLLYDGHGHRFTPSHATKRGGKRYRYYLNQPALLGNAHPANGRSLSRIRLPARDIEELVCKRICALLESKDELMSALGAATKDAADEEALCQAAREQAANWTFTAPAEIRRYLSDVLIRVVVQPTAVEIKLSAKRLHNTLLGMPAEEHGTRYLADREANPLTLRVDARLRRCGGDVRLIAPNSDEAQSAVVNHALLKAVARAHAWYEELISGRVTSFGEIAKHLGVHQRYVGRMIRSAFLAPDIVDAILAGEQPAILTVEKLRFGAPLQWVKQRQLFGFS